MQYNSLDVKSTIKDKLLIELSGLSDHTAIADCALDFILKNRLLVAKFIGKSDKVYTRMKCSKLIHDVGIVDIKITDELKPAYEVWRHMIRRACSAELKNKKNSYEHVTIAEEWLSFSNFLEFYRSEYREGYHLDKDILSSDVKIYSKDTCCFVPKEINGMIVNLLNNKLGTYFDKTKKKYRANISINSKTINLGNYDTLLEAQQVYLDAKTRHVTSVTRDYLDRGLISDRVADALNRKVNEFNSRHSCP